VPSDDGSAGLKQALPNEIDDHTEGGRLDQVVDLNKAAITRLGLMLADLRKGSGATGAASVLRTGAS